ncbi:hypothetical protein LINPERHAP2_LOCUS38647 [Linum perenne]
MCWKRTDLKSYRAASGNWSSNIPIEKEIERLTILLTLVMATLMGVTLSLLLIVILFISCDTTVLALPNNARF